MLGRILCKVGLHRRAWTARSRLGTDAVTTVRARACRRECGDYRIVDVEASRTLEPHARPPVTAFTIARLTERARRHPRLRRDPAEFPSGELVGKISREVWDALPDALQWQLLAIDDCEAGRVGVDGLRVILGAIVDVRALIDSFRARLKDGGDA